MWEESDHQEEPLTGMALVSTVAIATAVVVPVADAHSLSAAGAKREVAKVGERLGAEVNAVAVYACERRRAHVIVCRVAAVAADGAVCVADVRVSYRRHRDRRPARRVLSGPDCQPPELPAIL